MPIDADPRSGGTIVLEDAPDPRDPPLVKFKRSGTVLERPGQFKSHFATCPQADDHRRLIP